MAKVKRKNKNKMFRCMECNFMVHGKEPIFNNDIGLCQECYDKAIKRKVQLSLSLKAVNKEYLQTEAQRLSEKHNTNFSISCLIDSLIDKARKPRKRGE